MTALGPQETACRSGFRLQCRIDWEPQPGTSFEVFAALCKFATQDEQLQSARGRQPNLRARCPTFQPDRFVSVLEEQPDLDPRPLQCRIE